MERALELAREAKDAKETPVGAVVVLNGEVVGEGRNRVEELKNPAAHAEMLALREAALALNTPHLNGAELRVTLEPCAMCFGAARLYRVERVVYALADPRSGALESGCSPASGIAVTRLDRYGEEAAGLLRDFFEGLRQRR